MRLPLCSLPLLFVLVGTPAWAQNSSKPVSLELYPTFYALGARLAYTGDVNANATAHLEWRVQGTATWKQGVAMTRITNSRWAGSVFWLKPDSPYEVRAVIDDPDGGGSVTGAQRTRKGLPDTPSSRVWWVATTGASLTVSVAAVDVAGKPHVALTTTS